MQFVCKRVTVMYIPSHYLHLHVHNMYIVFYRDAMVKRGHALTRKFRKIKQFGAFWCILYFNQTSMKFTTNDSTARKQ